MPQPSDLQAAAKQKAQIAATTGSQSRIYYPTLDKSIPLQVQQALRQYGDHLNDIRNNYSPASQYIKGSGPVVLVTIPPNPTGFGISFQLTRQGVWMLTASVCLNLIGDGGQQFTMSLFVNSQQQPHFAIIKQAADGTVMMHQAWQVNSTAGDETCTLKIVKDAGGGTSNVDPNNSTLTGLWQGT